MPDKSDFGGITRSMSHKEHIKGWTWREYKSPEPDLCQGKKEETKCFNWERAFVIKLTPNHFIYKANISHWHYENIRKFAIIKGKSSAKKAASV